ncbi:MAG: hypothetical protein PVI90_00015 [Desulfobacteraceae bacterium]|jgi:micrococcal nuclease
MYTYNAKILKVIDGNTLELLIDLGMNLWTKKRIRFNDVETPCLWTNNTEEQKEAQRAKEFLENALSFSLDAKTTLHDHLSKFDVIIKTKKSGFDNFVGTVQIIGDGCTLGERLRKAGLEKKNSYGC